MKGFLLLLGNEAFTGIVPPSTFLKEVPMLYKFILNSGVLYIFFLFNTSPRSTIRSSAY